MTVASLQMTMKRIESAKKSSPIAVFRTKAGRLNSMFANTIWTQKEIEKNKLNYVGTFCKFDNQSAVFERLRQVELLPRGKPMTNQIRGEG